MNKATPSDVRIALRLVDALKMSGIDFVPVPVTSKSHKVKLLQELQHALDKIEADVETNHLTEKEDETRTCRND